MKHGACCRRAPTSLDNDDLGQVLLSAVSTYTSSQYYPLSTQTNALRSRAHQQLTIPRGPGGWIASAGHRVDGM